MCLKNQKNDTYFFKYIILGIYYNNFVQIRTELWIEPYNNRSIYEILLLMNNSGF